MAMLPADPTPESHEAKVRKKIFRWTRGTVLGVLIVLLVLCIAFAWTTRDAMVNLPFIGPRAKASLQTGGKKTVVDLTPWQTAQALAPLAVTAEETEYARDAERLADHEVDQAFASALRLATIQNQNRTLTGDALALSHKVDQLQKLVDQDQALVRQLTAESSSATKDSSQPSADDNDLEVAKAQLGLESDELSEAQEDLERESGDLRSQIQSELTAHEAAIKKYDSQSRFDGQLAVLSASRYSTMAGQLKAWNKQRSREQLIDQAEQQTQSDARSLTEEHNTLEAKANAGADASSRNAQDRTAKLANIKDRTAERQLLSIYDDRIQTEQQLASVYGKWAAQVRLQHRILLHLMLQSVALIVFILICMMVGDRLVRRAMSYPMLERRQLQTLCTVLELGVQIVGILLILLVIFGAPKETPTILGLTTAALTIALQDFILAFLGWFVLMGRKGIRIGDWVEINSVSGEVTELGLFSTTLLETGGDKGYPTGRRISFMNGYAIRGQYFNFSTTGMWMWDEVSLSIPASADTNATVERILKAIEEETKENTRIAEQEWKRGTRGDGLSKVKATPSVNLRPSGGGTDVVVRYVTRASERFDMRNRLYRAVIDLLRQPGIQPPAHNDPGAPAPAAR